MVARLIEFGFIILQRVVVYTNVSRKTMPDRRGLRYQFQMAGRMHYSPRQLAQRERRRSWSASWQRLRTMIRGQHKRCWRQFTSSSWRCASCIQSA